MNPLSDYLVKSIINERREHAQRLAQARQAARLAKAHRQAQAPDASAGHNWWQQFRHLFDFSSQGQQHTATDNRSEESLYHAEMLGVSTTELHHLTVKREMYERIFRGNALSDLDTRDSRFWRRQA